VGIGFFVLPAGIVGSGFVEELHHRQQTNQLQVEEILCKPCRLAETALPDPATLTNVQRRQMRLAHLLDAKVPDDPATKAVAVGLFVLIGLNVFAIMVETNAPIYERVEGPFEAFEVFSVLVFTAEYIARVWVCPFHENPEYRDPVRGRIRFMFSGMAIIDLLAILPFYLPFSALDLRFLRVVRLLRIARLFKAGHYSVSLDTFAKVVRKHKAELWIMVLLMFVQLVFVSSLIYFAERDAQPEVFSSIPQSLWWGIVTLTTVGNGDMAPVTSAGRALSVVTAFLGVGMFALPSGVLGAGLIDALKPRPCSRCGHETL
jgi:voltage-gated potassium channel